MKTSHERQNPSFCNLIWISGLVICGLGNVLNGISLQIGNVMLMAASSALTLVFNQIVAIFFLKEKLTRFDILALFLITSGSLSCMINSKTRKVEQTPDQLYEMLASPSSVAYILFVTIFSVVSRVADKRTRRHVLEAVAGLDNDTTL